MLYQITVPKIHCSGCVNLIKLSLEEVFADIQVNQESKVAEFTSSKDPGAVKADLNKVFEKLRQSSYEYTGFKQS